MKAIVVRSFGGPEVLALDDVPAPTPGPAQVAIRVHAVGVNPVDAYIRTGTYVRKPNLPYIPHTDIGGVVEEIGSNVTRFRKGDRVYAHAVNGGAAELAVCDEWQVQPLPSHVSFAQGAAIGVPYATAFRALFIRGAARAGETLLVHGASGGVGTAAVQLARAHGMHVIGTAGTTDGLKVIRDQGAHEALNHAEADYLSRIMPLTGGRGVNLVLEMLANINLDRDLDVLAPHGRVVVVGNRGRIEIDPRKTMGKDTAILGMTLANATPEEMHQMHSALVAGLENGTLKPVIAREFHFSKAAEAHEAVMGNGAAGKIVLVP